ncbi:hypothetical protein [Clostridium sp.]|uniref:hypothetical protein n=1 Tax=Clostridium sp. TaxID=1506 RepID=UPI0028490267|nr:hypothetical protein [Clostridium sp.]MDR3594962.1 hypothetical protein [Clostridium sp.]
MSSFKDNSFFKSIFSLLKSKDEKVEGVQISENKPEKSILVERTKAKKRVWKKEYNPYRNVVLWGYDENNNPSLLILYGEQEFASTEDNGQTINNILEDSVKYTSYAVFKGKEGHLPAFQSVKIIEGNSYYNKDKADNMPKMYYKTGIKNYWSKDENYRVKEFKNLTGEEQIVLPYFKSNSYEDYVKIIEEKNINFVDFKLVKHPNNILKLNGDSCKYYEVMYTLLSDQNLYMRKKALNELIEMKPSKDIYEMLLKIGSSELISGLFLEFAKRNNDLLIEDAKTILNSDIKWVEESYIKGVKRCAKIYTTVFDEELKAEREKLIKASLPDMDLHLIRIGDEEIPEGKILEGSAYRKYAVQGMLREYQGRYDYSQRKWVEYRSSQRYKVSLYSDGVVLKSLELKNTLQEAETYGLASVVGKIAYYLDAPRLNYYFRGNEKTKELKYYKRYAQRILNFYSKNDPEKFIEAIKALLTSYTEHDYVCKFRGNFQFNEFLKYYLYHDFKEKPPVGWDNWQARSNWMANDQLMKLQGRYEFMKEIWDNHLQDVLDIADKAKINPVLKACYYILKESEKTKDLIEKMSYKELVSLTEGAYKPLVDMFKEQLSNKLKDVNDFNVEIMISLMESTNEEIRDIARDFFNRTGGAFSEDKIAELMLLENIDVWASLFKESISSLDNTEYCNFVKKIINSSDKFISEKVNISEEIKELLLGSTNKVKDFSEDQKVDLISGMVSEVFSRGEMPAWVEEFIEEVIFSISYEDLDILLKKITIETKNTGISQRSRQIICILEAIQSKKLPPDSAIIGILETGSSKMINILFGAIMENTEELSTRFSTLLIMFESDITMLNKRAEEIFCNIIEEKRRKLHGIIIDSPVKKVYSFGLKKLDEIYKDLIPKEFIEQMLEHTSSEVKAYISNKTGDIINNLGNGDKELFMYYIKTLLFLPNKVSKGKDNLYEIIPKFALKHKDKLEEIENMLLDIGGSNIIVDSERALTTLVKIRKESALIEG